MFNVRVPAVLSLAILIAVSADAQIARNGNNPYSPSPDGRQKIIEIESISVVADNNTSSAPVPVPVKRRVDPVPVIERTIPLTELYKVGVGDVLFIELANVPQGHGYYTVRDSGTIDFQLAGGEVIVADKTPDTIARELADRITLLPDPRVEVKVREYGSHKVTVTGLVDYPGEKSLQREAIPLFVIRAEAGVKPSAGRAVITRAPLLKPEFYSLNDSATDDVLIYPGNSIEFVEAERSKPVYFISGNVITPGQKELVSGQTLYQAVAAAGGAKNSPRKGIIRRKNAKGVLAVSEYDLRTIKNGKAPDPVLSGGDVIEIGN